MSGNQTSGEEGGVQCVMMVVGCTLDIVYICLIERETQACRLIRRRTALKMVQRI